MIVRNTLQMFKNAREGHYAIPAFNTFNYEIMKGIHQAATEANKPVIMETESDSLQFCPPEILAGMAKGLSDGDSLPIGLHLDHCRDIDMTLRAMKCGYSSVMFDGSALDFDKNVRLTREVVKMGHDFGVAVEGELGIIGHEKHTDPEMAREFVRKTGVDCLAASVGTAHGLYKETPKLNFPLIVELVKASGAMVVLHGSSGVPFEDIAHTVRLGIVKVNIGTDLRRGFVDTVMSEASKGYTEARDTLQAGVDKVADICAKWISVCSAGN